MPKKYYSLVTNTDQSTADLYIFGDITSGWLTGYNERYELETGDVSGISIVKELKESICGYYQRTHQLDGRLHVGRPCDLQYFEESFCEDRHYGRWLRMLRRIPDLHGR